MVGLTGPGDKIKSMCKSFRVYYSKTDEENDGKDYLIDHSIIMVSSGDQKAAEQPELRIVEMGLVQVTAQRASKNRCVALRAAS